MKNYAGNRRLDNAELFGEVCLRVLPSGVQSADFLGDAHGEFGPFASADVLGVADDFEMVGIDTGSVPTNMVENLSSRDWASQPFVVDTVREPATVFGLQFTVAVTACHPLPIPTSSIGVDDVLMGGRSVLVSVNPANGMTLDPAQAGVPLWGYRRGLATTAHAKPGRVRANLPGTQIGPLFSGSARPTAQDIAATDGSSAINTFPVRIQGHSDDLLVRSDGATPTAASTARGFSYIHFTT